MAEKNSRRGKTKRGDSKLMGYCDFNYLVDLEHINKLHNTSDSYRDWIENTMLELRGKAPIYEHYLAEFLFSEHIEFIHQAPFVLSGKAYFADFFIPSRNVIVEVDGGYHNGIAQRAKDRFRDMCFNGHMVRVIRIPNKATMDKSRLKILLNGILN